MLTSSKIFTGYLNLVNSDISVGERGAGHREGRLPGEAGAGGAQAQDTRRDRRQRHQNLPGLIHFHSGSEIYFRSQGFSCFLLFLVQLYRVTIQLVQNLRLTSRQKFRFGLVCPGLARPTRNFFLDLSRSFCTN